MALCVSFRKLLLLVKKFFNNEKHHKILVKPKAGKTQYNTEEDCREGGRKSGWRTWSEVYIAATDRAGWLQSAEALCATSHGEDR